MCMKVLSVFIYGHRVSVSACGGQKRVLGLLAMELQMVVETPCGRWQANLGPLEENQVFLTTEPELSSTPRLVWKE